MLRPILVLGFIWLLILFGLPQNLEFWGRTLFWLIAIIAFGLACKNLLKLYWPSRAEGLARLELDSNLKPHVLGSLGDGLATGSQSLWQAHQARILQELKQLRYPKYHGNIGKADPIALRHGLGLALIVMIILHGGLSLTPIRQAMPNMHITPMRLDGWIAPPAYTGLAPVLLAKGEDINNQPISVPAGSQVIMQIAGDDARLFYRGEDLSLSDLQLRESGDLVLATRWRELARWQVKIIPDQEPKIAFSGEMQIGKGGEISLPYHIQDDYGVTDVKIGFSLSDQQEDGEGILGYGPFLAPPPQLDIVVPGDGRDAKGQIRVDLTRHSWAGLYVDVRLVARDGAGQLALSEPLRIKLPERPFDSLVARAVVEQRRFLLRDPDNQPRVVAALDALSHYPDAQLASSANWLELRAITRKLYRAMNEAMIFSAAEDIWNFAVRIDADVTRDARAQLEKARDELQKAITEKASPEIIAQKIEALRQAMQEYLRAMADAARRGQMPENSQQSENRRQINPQDLARMLNELSKMAQSGDMQAAQDALAALDQLLQNLQMGQGQNGNQSGEGNGQAEAIQDLRELRARQQGLMDETYRLSPNDEAGAQALSQQQQQLNQELNQLMQDLADQGFAVPDGLNDALPQMNGAQSALQETDRQAGLNYQQRALEHLQDAQQSMLQQLTGQVGPSSSGGKDPLNRDRAVGDQGLDREYLNGQSQTKPAREILDELRRKRGQPGLTRMEEDYLDRLLRGLY